MRIKLDENLGQQAAELLRKAGHDVTTVPKERLCAASDRQLIETCHAERRCLVTMDLDFGNPLLFPPTKYSGIVVLRLPSRFQPEHLTLALNRLIGGLAKTAISGRLWIVEVDRIREYQPEAAGTQ